MNRLSIRSTKLMIVMIQIIALLLFVGLNNEIDSKKLFLIMTAVFLLLSIANLVSILKSYGKEGLFSITSLFYIFQFVVQIGIGNFAYIGEQTYYFPGWNYMVKTMYVMFVAQLGYSIGMESNTFTGIGLSVHKRFFGRLDKDYTINIKACVIVFIISIPIYLWAMNMGIIGYERINQVSAASNIAQLVVYMTHLMSMTLYILYIDIIKNNNKRGEKFLFIIFLAIRLLMAFLSGMKADIILTFACLVIISFIFSKKINKFVIFLGVVISVVVYSLNDVFRALLRNASFSGFSRMDLLRVSIASITSGGISTYDVGNSFLMRLGISESCGAVIKYIDIHGLTSTAPTFLQDLVLLPLSTFFPRSILPWKSVLNYGLWVTNVVHGNPSYSASYLTIEGFFYAIGGMFAVFLGFYILAKILDFITGVINLRYTNEVLLCTFLMLCTTQIFEPNDPVTMVTGLLRGIIIYPLLGYVLIKHKNSKNIK